MVITDITAETPISTQQIDESPLDRFIGRLHNVKRSGIGYVARCPAHDDNRGSLSITEGNDGRVLVKCFADCTFKDIVDAVSLQPGDLFPRKERAHGGSNRPSQIVATYDYFDETGALLYQVIRFAPKRFLQRRPDRAGHWVWGLAAGDYIQGVDGDWRPLKRGEPAPDGMCHFPECRRVLYRLSELRNADPLAPVYVVEGEKDVETLRGLGLVATTSPQGAGKWRPEYSQSLRGRNVVILPDNDDAGRMHAEAIAAALYGGAA